MKWISLYIQKAVGVAMRKTELEKYEKYLIENNHKITEKTEDYIRAERIICSEKNQNGWYGLRR